MAPRMNEKTDPNEEEGWAGEPPPFYFDYRGGQATMDPSPSTNHPRSVLLFTLASSPIPYLQECQGWARLYGEWGREEACRLHSSFLVAPAKRLWTPSTHSRLEHLPTVSARPCFQCESASDFLTPGPECRG
jgi:hypothetical protein